MIILESVQIDLYVGIFEFLLLELQKIYLEDIRD